MYSGMRERPDHVADEVKTERYSGEAGLSEEDGMQPYFMLPEYRQVTQEQQEAESGLRRLQSMYPEAAKLMLPYVVEECDRLEYEGSPMFDEYPDRTTLYRIEEHIYEQVKDQFPEEAQEPEKLLPMQDHGPRMGGPGRSWARDLARVLLLNEMHHRRSRHRAIRNARFAISRS